MLIFGFFVVAKIHVYKFRHYNANIEPVTKALAIALAVLAVAGYYLLFSGAGGTEDIRTVEQTADTEIY